MGVGDYRSWTQYDDTAKHWFKFKPQRERSRKWEEPKKNSEVFEAAAQTEKLFADSEGFFLHSSSMAPLLMPQVLYQRDVLLVGTTGGAVMF